MKKGHWIAMMDVTDPGNYPRYIAASAGAFAMYGARFLARGGRFESPEGPTGARHVIIEVDGFEQALACSNSSEYQDAAKLRRQFAAGRFAVVEGA